MLFTLIWSCWNQTYSISQCGIHYKPWSHIQSTALISLSTQSPPPTTILHPAPPPVNEAMAGIVPTTLPVSNLLSVPSLGKHNSARGTAALQSEMWEMYIFVSANTKQRRLLGQNQTDGSKRGRRSERRSLPPSLFPFLCFYEKTLSELCLKTLKQP